VIRDAILSIHLLNLDVDLHVIPISPWSDAFTGKPPTPSSPTIAVHHPTSKDPTPKYLTPKKCLIHTGGLANAGATIGPSVNPGMVQADRPLSALQAFMAVRRAELSYRKKLYYGGQITFGDLKVGGFEGLKVRMYKFECLNG
jgi:hypothetical protein